jgi:glycosyltransferase involved in cell wall biosynthesis
MTTLSVVIPVRNGRDFIAQTLWSLTRQSRPPDEIIVLDDGSDDGTTALALAVAPDATVIEGPFGGAAAARAVGAREARGDALMFLDADDVLGHGTLEALAATLEENPGAIAVCDWKRLELSGGVWVSAPASCVPRQAGDDDLSAWLRGWYHPPCAVLWSREAYEASGGWDGGIASNQDGDVMMRALVAGVPLRRAPGGVAYYRRVPGGGTISGRRGTLEGLTAQLVVVHRIEQRLRETGRTGAYAGALRAAYQRVEGHAREHKTRAPSGAPQPETAVLEAPVLTGRSDADATGTLGERPLVSVVVPAYERADVLARALATVVAQSYERLEILVVDDGSTEDLCAVVDGFADPRMTLLVHPQNRGTGAARNTGLAHATGELVAFLDSDDEWLPEKIARQVALFRAAPRATGLVYSSVLEATGRGAPVLHTASARGDVRREMMWRNVIHFGMSSTVVRREVALTVGGFDEALPAIEDYDFFVRVGELFAFEVVAEPLIVYHNEAAATGQRSRHFRANTAARQAFLRRYAWAADEAGVLHHALLEAARRQLESREGNSILGAYLVLKAIRSRTREPRLFAWLALALLPRGVRLRLSPHLKRLRRELPEGLWFGRDGPAGGADREQPERVSTDAPTR